jgi:hypothetical protein
MKQQGLLNKKIIIAYKFQSSAITGRSKLHYCPEKMVRRSPHPLYMMLLNNDG